MRSAFRTQRGFTLIELVIALAILAVLASAAIPYAATQIRNQAAEKVAREMLAIADAAKSFYVANAAWPPSIAALETAGYLPSSWSATNPFGNAYTISSGTTLTVASTVATDVARAVARLVPLETQTAVARGVSVAGTWPRPGQSSDLSQVVLKDGSVAMTGPLNFKDSNGILRIFLDPTTSQVGVMTPTGAQVVTLTGDSDGYGTMQVQGRLNALIGYSPGSDVVAGLYVAPSTTWTANNGYIQIRGIGSNYWMTFHPFNLFYDAIVRQYGSSAAITKWPGGG